MTPINTVAGSYGRVASSTATPQERPPAAQTTQPASGPTQRPSTVVNISPEARERAETAERAAQTPPTPQGNDASSRAQSDTRAAQNQSAQAAAAQNASGPQGPSS